MARQYLKDGPYMDPPVSNPLTADVATTITPMWTGLSFTPIFANDPKAGKVYVVKAGGLITTGASGSLIITPNHGANSIAMGPSTAQNVPVSLTGAIWRLQMEIVYRTIGAAGLNSTCVGTGVFWMPGTIATAGSGTVIPFGGTVATVDASINNSITISKTLSVAGSFTTQWAYITSEN